MKRRQMPKREIKEIMDEINSISNAASNNADKLNITSDNANAGFPAPKQAVMLAFENGTDMVEVVCSEEKPIAFKLNGILYPSIAVGKTINLPALRIDTGAVRFVCKGADLMRPGIKEIIGEFKSGALVSVQAENGMPIAIGASVIDSEEMIAMQNGKAVKIIHRLGDEIDNCCKNS